MGCGLLAAIGSFALLLLGIAIMVVIVVLLNNFHERYEERKERLNDLEAKTNRMEKGCIKLEKSVFSEERGRYGVFGYDIKRIDQIKESQDKIKELELTIVDLNDRICDLEKRRK